MHAPVRLAILVFALAMPIACAIATPPQPPPTLGATVTLPALTPTPPIVSTTDTPAPPAGGLATQPRGLTAVNNFEPSTRVGGLFDDRTYANPNVAGLTFRTSWADIEPAEGDIEQLMKLS